MRLIQRDAEVHSLAGGVGQHVVEEGAFQHVAVGRLVCQHGAERRGLTQADAG